MFIAEYQVYSFFHADRGGRATFFFQNPTKKTFSSHVE